MRNNIISLFSFETANNYIDALRTQQLCFRRPDTFSPPSFFRIETPLNLSRLDTNVFHKVCKQYNLDATQMLGKLDKSFYTNSILENAINLIAIGVFFRSLEVFGYKLKQNIIERFPRKNPMMIRFYFDLAFIATTIFVVPSLFDVDIETFLVSKVTEYAFRTLAYAFQNKYSVMDYAQNINLVSILNKSSLKDLAILKGLMFANNCIATALKYYYDSIHFSAEALKLNGLFVGPRSLNTPYFACNHNNVFLQNFQYFVNVVEELGFFTGKLLVDLFILVLEYIGIVKDPNTVTLDTENIASIPRKIANIPSNARRRYNSYFHRNQEAKVINPQIVEANSWQNDNFVASKQDNTTVIQEVHKPKEKTRKCGPVKMEEKPNDTPKKEITLPKNVVVIKEKLPCVPLHLDKITTFAIHLSDNPEFDKVLQNCRSKITMMKTYAISRGRRPSYELKIPVSDDRLMGTLEKSSTALSKIEELTNKNFAATLGNKFDAISSSKGTGKNWQCFIFIKPAGHVDQDKVAKSF